ncbi:MAG: hypothetical protein O2816_10540 [Planctomycetota bacterium]|nr:hypothetical protein [Planctomycetota bacterium]
MDFENYWQENKRSLTMIGGGLLVFLIANMIVNSTFGGELADAQRDKRTQEGKLRSERYDRDGLSKATLDNERLQVVHDALLASVVFESRPEFQADPNLGSIAAQYFTRVEEVRDQLTRRASRSGMRADQAWGVEVPETNLTPVIERHLEALDLIDRVANLAIDTGVTRIAKIQVTLDPAFDSKRGVGRLEKTRVTFTLDTTAMSVTRLVSASQRSQPYGQPLTLEGFKIKGERTRPGQVTADLTFLVVRLTQSQEDE